MRIIEGRCVGWTVSCALVAACGGDHEPEDAGLDADERDSRAEDVGVDAPEDTPGDSADDASRPILELDCEGDEYAYYFFTYDGEEGNTGCLTPTARASNEDFSSSVERLTTEERGSLGSPLLCSASVDMINVPVAFSVDNPPTIRVVYGAAEGDCDEVALQTDRTWNVIGEGSWEDLVELEARDVTFAPVGGHELTLDRMFFRVRLPMAPAFVEPNGDAGIGDAASDT